MSKFKLSEIPVGQTVRFCWEDLGYKCFTHLRRNLSVTVFQFMKRNPDRLLTTMSAGEHLLVRRWK